MYIIEQNAIVENRVLTVERQLQRTSQMEYIIQSTKTNAGTRKLPLTEDITYCFEAIIQDRDAPAVEKMVGGHVGFLFLDKNGMPELNRTRQVKDRSCSELGEGVNLPSHPLIKLSPEGDSVPEAVNAELLALN